MIRIHLHGRFEVVRGEKVLCASDWPRRKAATLLQYLALSRRALRDEVIELLWPESDPTSGANNLYRTLHALRQTLDTHLGEGSAQATLAFEEGTFMLHDAVWVDTEAFQRAAEAALTSPTRAALQAALALYGGHLLPDDVYADWTTERREGLRRLHREVGLKLATLHIEARQYTEAIRC